MKCYLFQRRLKISMMGIKQVAKSKGLTRKRLSHPKHMKTKYYPAK
jgi:hypothetical protein